MTLYTVGAKLDFWAALQVTFVDTGVGSILLLTFTSHQWQNTLEVAQSYELPWGIKQQEVRYSLYVLYNDVQIGI